MRSIAVCLLLLVMASVGARAAWTPPANLTRTGVDCASVVVGVDGAGRVHALVNRSAGQGMWHFYVENEVRHGWQWLSNGVAPALAGDSLGRMHAVWSEGWEIRYRRWSNGAWEPGTTTVSDGTGDAVKSDVCIDSADNVHVVWGKGSDVWYNRRSSATGLWDGPQRITFFGDAEGYLPPRVGAVGTAPVVVWGRDWGGESRSVWFSSRESGFWTHTQLPTAHAGASACDIDVTPSGEIHCTWDDAYDIWHARRVSGTWQLLGVMTTGSSSLSPRISAPSVSKADIVWRDNAPGFGDAYTSRWNGSAWATPHGLAAATSGGVVSPDIARDHWGWQHVCFSQGWDIHYATDQATDAVAPPAPVVSPLLNAASQVTLCWTNPEAIDLSRVRIVYRTDRAPEFPSDGTIIVDRPASWGPDTFTHIHLTNGVRYYYSIFVCDEVPNWSPAACVTGEPWSTTCRDAKGMSENQQLTLKDKTVSAVFLNDGCIYVQEPNRTSGIRVAWTGAGIAVGDRVDVSGVVTTRTLSGQPSERQISSATVVRTGSDPAKPLGLTCRLIGGAAIPGAPGVRDGLGLHNMGLLVRITGRVTKVLGSYIYVDDGSMVVNASTSGPETGVMVKCASTPYVVAGSTVAVTGVVVGSIQSGWTANRPYIQTRTGADLVKLH